MTDKEKIIQLYREMYTAMVNKDRAELECVHDDSFVLVHMTGMRQPKKVYISSIMDGTLNYYSAEHEDMQVEINGDKQPDSMFQACFSAEIPPIFFMGIKKNRPSVLR